MPELPEVEIARRQLLRWLEGREVVSAEGDRTRIFRGSSPERLAGLRGKLDRAERKGKYLLLSFEGGRGLLAHLGMTGKFVRRPAGHAEPYSRARLALDSGEVVHFRDPRMFGRLEPVPSDQLWSLPVVRALGVDPLVDGLDWKTLRDAVGDSRQALKVALMDQGRVAGLGNIHAAEALFRAGLHPARSPRTLTDEEWKRLATAIRATLKFALEDQHASEEIEYVEEPGAPNPFRVYGWAGTAVPQVQGGRDRVVHPGRAHHLLLPALPTEAEDKTMSKAKAKGLDHVAIAVKDLDKAIALYRDTFGLELAEIEEVADQQVRTAIFGHGSGRIELICPTSPDTGVAKFLEKRGEGLHHICVEVEDIDAHLADLKAKGVPLIDQTARIGAGGSKVAFVHPKGGAGVLIELSERVKGEAGH